MFGLYTLNPNQQKLIMLSTIIGLISGAVGGNVAGSLLKGSSLGTLWNSVAGIAGGGLGASLIGMLSPSMAAAAESGSMDPMSILSSVGGGLAGGGVVMTVIGFIKKAMAK